MLFPTGWGVNLLLAKEISPRKDIQMNVFMYSHPLLLVQPVSICKIDEVVDEQIGQQFPPD